MIRVGFGYDVHRLEPGLPLWVGGVSIPHEKGALGHSDADVLLHAICDALLGAAALGDIGDHFPDTDPSYRGISSSILLERTLELIRSKGYSIVNLDSTICVQRPRIKPFFREMRHHIASVAQISEQQVSVKATTEEKLGFTGREEGIAAYAVVLLEKPG